MYCISQHGKHRYGERKISHVKHYVSSLAKAWARGDATEHTHRAALAQLIEASLPGLDATNEPKSSQRENKPDYLLRKHNTLVGYVEAKDLDADLASVLKSAQIKRYQEALPNLLVTNYLDFVWLLGPEKRMTISLGTLRGKVIDLHPDADARWNELIRSFCDEVTPTLGTPQQLAASLAGQTRLLRDLVAELLGTGDEALQAQYAAFKSLLMPNLQAEEFGDMYAQTAVYGLFTARVFESTTLYGAAPEKLPAHLRKGEFNLEKAGFLIPRANPFLRQFFQHVASPDLSEQLRWLIEQVAFSLRYTDMDKVLHRHSRKQGFEDPVFHFYETFLGAYNQKLREQRGVYYTPQPVVDFMVRSVDTLLKTALGKPDGLADKDTLILDPATGTATFLRRVIDQIYVLDLHGNAKKKEHTPAALAAHGDDKNVFDIEQGVAITVLIKRKGKEAAPAALDLFGNSVPGPRQARSELPRKALVRHAEVWGSREHKYHWLQSSDWNAMSWQTLEPAAPLLLFVPRNEAAAPDYERGWKVTDIFPTNSVGIVTARDALTIHFTPAELQATIARFSKLGVEQARSAFDLGPDAQDWQVEWAQQDLRNTACSPAHFQAIAYRPFDVRHTYYTGKSKGFHCRARGEVMGHFARNPNLGLAVGRAGAAVGDEEWNVAFVSSGITEFNLYRRGGNNLLPLWLHPPGKPPQPNIAPAFLHALAESLGLPHEPECHDLPRGVAPEDVLAYVYAVLHAPGYRSRYAEFLKSDFPRIPLGVVDGCAQTFAQLWQALLPLGRTLIDLHLLRQVPSALRPRFPVAGDNTVDKQRREAGTDRVYINATQYFDGVPQATWEFKVGGYQVCEKWLKDRKGRTLTLEDVEHYQNTVAALTQTRTLMAEIDALATGALWPAPDSGG